MGGGARWQIDLHPDPFSIQHWSIWAGLVELDRQGIVTLRNRDAGACGGSGLWITVSDRELDSQRDIWVDVGDRAPAVSERREKADISWVRNSVDPVGLPLGYVAPMRMAGMPQLGYLAAAAAVAFKQPQRSVRAVRAAAWCFRRSRLPAEVESFEHPPGGAETVLFQVRCWEPHESGDPDDRHRVNEARAQVIRTLRLEFGSRFQGGFQRRDYAHERYPDCITTLPDDQPGYLSLVRRAGIVVGSTGLHGSLPWKLAEYAAMSRAVVAERNENAVPDSHRGVYATYDSVDECVEQCARLLDDSSLRQERQEAAQALWRNHVRPDRLVLDRLHETFDSRA